jgi:hypothetical protein
MSTKLIQAAAITFVLYLVMGMKATGTTQSTSAAIAQTTPTQKTSLLSHQVAELIALYKQH